jgi:hypothetical protein
MASGIRARFCDFALMPCDAEGSHPDASFDFAISEYGACLSADPQRWIAEAARLLRPGLQDQVAQRKD